jgi:hypothetical protein
MKTAMLALVGTFTFASVAVAVPPDAPTITVAASNIKQLQFDITPVTRISWYELWFKASSGAQWVYFSQTPAQRPRFRISRSVHLLDWREARFHVKACNSASCSQSNEVGVDGLQLDAMGYFKPSRAGSGQYFGFNFAVSADGMTMVVVAAERIDHVSGRAALHVFRKATPTSGWGLDARLLPIPNAAGASQSSGDSVSISHDGKLFAFSNWIENGTSGAVYLFRRESDGWHQQQRITGDNFPSDHFGINVKLDPAGRTLVIGHDQVGGTKREGTLEVYRDLNDGNDQFVHTTTVPTPTFDDPLWGWCRPIAVSDVGHIVRSCFSGTMQSAQPFYTQVFKATSWAPLQYKETARLPGGSDVDVAIDFKGERLLIHNFTPGHTFVEMYRCNAGDWVKDGTLEPFPNVGHAAISGDGKIVAIGWTEDTLVGRGPVFPPYQRGDRTGTVAIYERRASGWALRRYVKADPASTFQGFGWDVALNQNGHTLAVGAPYDSSKATGVDGDREDASVLYRGAVWLY